MEIQWSLLIAYAVGTALGMFWGFKRGVRTGAGLTVLQLCLGGYVKYTGDPATDVELYKLDEDMPEEEVS